MYYDVDSLASDEAPPYYATDIVKSRKAVCLGFATLMASLCRSIDIPCNVVSGYALGVGNDTAWTDISIATDEQNHAWNEVYVDGRWMIVDTTWDCANKIENGEMNKGEVSHLYFDANLQFFSNNHKILEYSKEDNLTFVDHRSPEPRTLRRSSPQWEPYESLLEERCHEVTEWWQIERQGKATPQTATPPAPLNGSYTKASP